MDYPYYGWHHKLPIMRAPDYHWRTEEQPEHASELPEQAPLDFSILFSPVAKWRRNLTFKLYRELHNQIGIQEATSLNFLSRLAKVADENSTLYKQFFIHSCANPHSATSRIGKDCLRIINGIESRIPIRQEFLDTIEQLSKNVDLETKMIAQYLLDKHPRPRSTFSASWLRNCVSREDLSEARMHLEELNITCQDCIKVCDVELLIQQDASTRRGQYNANRKRRVDNVSRMKDMIAWRDKEAKYLGFLNRAKFKANSQMGSCAICIEILIHDLRKTLVESATRRLHELLELKIKSLPRSGYARGLEKDVLYDWDYSFCKNLSTNGDGGNIVDWKKISEYLELNNTLKATLRVLGTLFGLKFREIRAGTPSTCISLYSRQKVWQQDVEIYSVWDKSRDQQTGFLGYLYLDLYSRPKKSMKPGHYCLQAVSNILLLL
jgi:Zn-dependent oligopeptidase